MKQWIRWPGLIAFVVIVALLVAFFMFAAGPLAKRAIESLGARAVGAKVEVAEVQLTLSPFGLIVHDVQIADARQPMQNALHIQRAAARLEVAPLLLGKVIVHDLQVDQLQLNTVRTTSGALPAPSQSPVAVESESDTTVSGESSWSVELPTFEDLLARQSLQTDQASAQAKQALSDSEQRLEQTMAALPNEQSVSDYERQAQVLLSGSIDSIEEFRRRQQALRDLQQQVRSDQEAIRSARQAVQQSQRDMDESWSSLRAAPAHDMAQLRTMYALDGDGAANMSALLFGEQAGDWARTALHWYGKISPYLSSASDAETPPERERLQGRYVHFHSDDPWPAFLIRQAQISIQFEQGVLALEVVDVTHQQRVLKRPLRAWLRSEQWANADTIKASLVLDHRQSPSNDLLDLSIKDYRLSGLNLGLGGATLDDARVQVDSTVVVLGGLVDAQTVVNARDAQFVSSGKTQFARELGAALSGIDQFTVRASAEGSLRQPRVTLSSDLDQQLQAALAQRLRQQQARLEQQLQSHLNQQVSRYSEQYQAEIQQLQRYEQQFEQWQQRVAVLQSYDLGDYTDHQRRQAEQQAKDAEEKAAADARQRQRELESQARDRVRRLF